MHPAARARDLDDLARRLGRCRLCNRAADEGGPAAARERVSPPPISSVRPGQRALIVGQAPGIHEPVRGLPFAADAGRRLRRWFAPLGLEDEEAFRATFAMSAVVKCYPGREPGARGDRRPTPGQLARCAPWTAAHLRLLAPPLVIPVGGLAIERFCGKARLVDVIGERFEVGGRAIVPLPHPSGASAWVNLAGNRALVTRAIALIGTELDRS